MGIPEPTIAAVGDCGSMLPATEGLWCLPLSFSANAPKRRMVRNAPALLSRVPVVDGETSSQGSVHDGSIEIGRGEIHLWFVQLELMREALSAMAESLDPGERDRAARRRFEPHRNQYVAAHGALRRVLSAYLGLPAGDIRYASQPFGRPQLAPVINPGSLDFSLSHSGGLAVVAVAGERRVGVDVEELRDLRLEHELAEQTLSAAEWAEWRRYPAEVRTRAFLRLWTRKEACLKVDGRGLRRDLRQVPVGSDMDGGLRWSRVTPYGHGQPGWAVCSLEVIPGYMASVAVAQ